MSVTNSSPAAAAASRLAQNDARPQWPLRPTRPPSLPEGLGHTHSGRSPTRAAQAAQEPRSAACRPPQNALAADPVAASHCMPTARPPHQDARHVLLARHPSSVITPRASPLQAARSSRSSTGCGPASPSSTTRSAHTRCDMQLPCTCHAHNMPTTCPQHAHTMPTPCPHQVRAYTSVPDCACLTCSSNWRGGAGRQLQPCPAISAWLAQACETNWCQ